MRILLEKLRYKKSDNCHLELERENGKERKREREGGKKNSVIL